MSETLKSKPADCPLTDEQWERMLPELRDGEGIWLPRDLRDMDAATLQKLTQALNMNALDDIVRKEIAARTERRSGAA